jgi:uncharacterized protein YndB with AHSA1/START domain
MMAFALLVNRAVPPLALALALTASVEASARDRILRAEIRLEAPVADVWHAWTTDEGIRTFFAPASHVELRVDGAYQILFSPAQPPGRRGAEGARLLVLEPPHRLAFTWDAPADQPEIRAQRTVVYVELTADGERATSLRFTHLGWGKGPQWDAAFDYFDQAWNAVVLPRLRERFLRGPIDWTRPPRLAPVAPTLKTTRADRR